MCVEVRMLGGELVLTCATEKSGAEILQAIIRVVGHTPQSGRFPGFRGLPDSHSRC